MGCARAHANCECERSPARTKRREKENEREKGRARVHDRWAVLHTKILPANCFSSLRFLAFNHDQSGDAEQEYDRLRDLARQEASKRGDCFQRVRDNFCSHFAMGIELGASHSTAETQ